jgi:hypothetical protein
VEFHVDLDGGLRSPGEVDIRRLAVPQGVGLEETLDRRTDDITEIGELLAADTSLSSVATSLKPSPKALSRMMS